MYKHYQTQNKSSSKQYSNAGEKHLILAFDPTTEEWRFKYDGEGNQTN